MFFQYLQNDIPEMRLFRILFAADTQHRDSRHQMKGMGKGLHRPDINGKSCKGNSFSVQFLRHRTKYRPGASHPHTPSRHQLCRNLSGICHGIHKKPPPRRKDIHRKFSMQIRSRGDHRIRTQNPGCQTRHGIGSPNMSGQQGDHMLPLLIRHKNRRIRLLALHKRCNTPDCNSRCTDKDQCIRFCKLFFRPLFQRCSKYLYAFQQNCVLFLYPCLTAYSLPGQSLCQSLRKHCSMIRKADNLRFHQSPPLFDILMKSSFQTSAFPLFSACFRLLQSAIFPASFCASFVCPRIPYTLEKVTIPGSRRPCTR